MSLPPSSSPGPSSGGYSPPAPPSPALYSPPPTPPPPPPPRAASPSKHGVAKGLIAGSVTGGFVILVVLSLLLIYYRKKRGDGVDVPLENNDRPYDEQPKHNAPPPAYASRPPHSPAPPPPPSFMRSSGGSESNYSVYEHPPPQSPSIALGFSTSIFTYEELEMATDYFSETNILGQGGFGFVYKGVLTNGKEVAIKSLKADSVQGDREFEAEVEIISRVHHKHLVSLLGYCIYGSQRMLVYEFVPNKTLQFHLHGKGRPIMNWSTRLKIALGAAKGLAYVHEDCNPKIIHRDIKAANILLDSKFEAKVADFGLAKFSSDANTHVSTRVMGTFGYLAPEYAASGKLTDKSDVFSFGVMLLELITGHPPISSAHTFINDSLVDWARPLLTRALEDHNYDTLVDPRLQKDYNPTEMARMVACAAACVCHSAQERPFMSKIIRALEGDMSVSNLNDTSLYNEDMKKFQMLPFSNQECATSEYSGSNSEYGLHPSGSSSTEGQKTSEEMEMRRMKKYG